MINKETFNEFFVWEEKNSIGHKKNCVNNSESVHCDIITETKNDLTKIVSNDTMMRKSGIYKIVNKVNNNYYVGRTSNFHVRWRTHRLKLRENRHDNQHLQNAWNLYGENAFEFTIVELIDKNIELLKQSEDRYIVKFMDDRKRGINDCYNKSDQSGGGLQSEVHRIQLKNFATGRKPSEETRRKLSEAAKARVARDRQNKTGIFSPEHRALVSEINSSNQHCKGKIHSDETKQKISAAVKGEKHPRYGHRKQKT